MAGVMYQFSWELKKACKRMFRYLLGYLLALFFLFLFYKLQKESIISLCAKLYELPDEVLGFLGLRSKPDFLQGYAWLTYLLQVFRIAAVVFAMHLGVESMVGWEEKRLAVFFLSQPKSRFQAWWKKQAAGILTLLVSNIILALVETLFVYWISITVYRMRIREIFADIAGLHFQMFLIQMIFFLLMGGAALWFYKKRHAGDLIFYFTILSFLVNVWGEILDFAGFVMESLMGLQVQNVMASLNKLRVIEKASLFWWLSPMEPRQFSVIGTGIILFVVVLGNWLLFWRREIIEE